MPPPRRPGAPAPAGSDPYYNAPSNTPWAPRNPTPGITPDFYRPPAIGEGTVLRDPAPRPAGRRARPRPVALPPIVSTPSPYQDPGLWDSLFLAGNLYLGTVKVGGDALGVDLDVSKSSGRDGSHVRDKGIKPGKVKITVAIWDEVTWASWDALLPTIDPRRQVGRRTPIDVGHPALSQRNVSRVYIESISYPDVKDTGLIEVTINGIEFRPPSRAATGHTATTRTGPLTIEGFRTAFTGTERVPTANAPAPPSTNNTGPRRAR